MKKKLIYIFLLLGVLCPSSCTDLEEIYYSEVASNNFFQTKDNVYAVFARPFTRWRGFALGWNEFKCLECSADQFCITRKGNDHSSTNDVQMHHHTWQESHGAFEVVYRELGNVLSITLSTMKDLSYVDYEKLGLTQADKKNHQLQLKTMGAYCYLRLMDFFGGLPLYREYTMIEAERSSARETFNLIEEWLLEGLASDSNLEKRKTGQIQEGWVNQGVTALILARLYLNAEVYIGEPRFKECAEICQNFIDGKYGYYELSETWNEHFGFRNDLSDEVIWNATCDFIRNQAGFGYSNFLHYNSYKYLNIDGLSHTNAAALQPSLDPTGKPYRFKLGTPFARFHDQDLRKKPYKFTSPTEYEGMFLYGKQERTLEDGTVLQCLGTREYSDQVITFVDNVGRFSEVGPGKRYSDVSQLPSTIQDGEENSGVRIIKRPIPDNNFRDELYNPDLVMGRYAEIYYTLAECKYRAGDKQEAADLFNAVRKRNFEGGNDPDPVTASNINKYRILEEWGIEFIWEQRRRTDLRRWNAFTTETWWDHTPSEHYRNLFPFPESFISASEATILQNPGYGQNCMSDEDAGLFVVPNVD